MRLSHHKKIAYTSIIRVSVSFFLLTRVVRSVNSYLAVRSSNSGCITSSVPCVWGLSLLRPKRRRKKKKRLFVRGRTTPRHKEQVIPSLFQYHSKSWERGVLVIIGRSWVRTLPSPSLHMWVLLPDTYELHLFSLHVWVSVTLYVQVLCMSPCMCEF